MPLLPILLLGVGIFAASKLLSGKSSQEAQTDTSDTPDDLLPGRELINSILGFFKSFGQSAEAIQQEKVRDVASAILNYPNKLGGKGVLYSWGKPGIETIKLGDVDAMLAEGADCSGCTLTIGVHCGYITPDWAVAHRRADDIGKACDKVDLLDVKVGDLAWYSGHITVVVGFDDETGEPLVLSMSGGGSNTHGDDANAKAKVYGYDYRSSNFQGFVRYPGQEQAKASGSSGKTPSLTAKS